MRRSTGDAIDNRKAAMIKLFDYVELIAGIDGVAIGQKGTVVDIYPEDPELAVVELEAVEFRLIDVRVNLLKPVEATKR